MHLRLLSLYLSAGAAEPEMLCERRVRKHLAHLFVDKEKRILCFLGRSFGPINAKHARAIMSDMSDF